MRVRRTTAALILATVLIAASLGGVPSVRAELETGNITRYSTQGYLGIPPTPPYNVSFRQASLREVLQFLAWIAEINIMIPEGIEGVVNVNFSDITIGDALNTIIKANSLEYTIEGGVLRIGKGEQFKETGEDLKTHTFRLHFAPAARMAEQVRMLLSNRGSVIADERTNSVIVRELPSNIDNVRRFVDDVDVKDTQVLIESKLLEATRTFSQSLGIQWGVTRGAAGDSFRVAGFDVNQQGGTTQQTTPIGATIGGRSVMVDFPPSVPTSGLIIGTLFKGVNIDAQILAAEKRGDAYVISDPSIVTSNGSQAKIRSGATLLIQSSGDINIGTGGAGSTTSGTTGGTGLQEIETGVELKVTPQITMGDYVKLDIEVETSTPDFARAVQGIPIIVDNTANTAVLVKDGETTVIGGLSRYSDSLQKNRVPYLHRIPLLGNLFKGRDKMKENTELMVFIKPTIVRGEGRLPAQVRVREVEQRQEAMYMEPIIDPRKKAEEKLRLQERIQDRSGRGNKYVR